MSKPPTDADRLRQFLDDEVRDTAHAELLKERTQKAAAGQPQLNASGNAYNVTFGLHKVRITHHFLTDWPAVERAPRDFIADLEDHCRRLES